MTWEQDAAAAIRGLKAENERLREENNVLSAREARAENSALHLGALVDELRGLLRDINSRPRHLNAGAWEIRLYQDDYDRIDAALAGAAVQPSSPADGQPVAEGVARAEVVPYPYGEGRTDQPSAATENPEAMYNPVARGGHAGASARQIDVAAGDQLAAGQPERCCLDYPRCDCNSPPEPDNAPALQPCGHPWKAQHDSKCILCSSPGVTP